MTNEKQRIIEALYAWIAQRPGLDYGNYGNPTSYRAEVRSIGKDLQHARQLLRAVELSGITADELKAAFSAFSGRMTWDGKQLDYCTGQYWPTEYRKVVCAIAAQALWRYKADTCMPTPTGKTYVHDEAGKELYSHNLYDGKRAGDWLRRSFLREYGRSIQTRWFN